MLSDHIKQDIFLAYQAGSCVLLYESSAEARAFLYYFRSAISDQMSTMVSWSFETGLKQVLSNCTVNDVSIKAVSLKLL